MVENGSPVDRAAADASAPRRIWPAVRTLLRARITAGLVTIIPIWITYELVRWVFNFVFRTMTSFTEPLAKEIADLLSKSPQPIVAGTVEKWLEWVVPVLALLITLSLLYGIGLASANVFGRRIILFVEQFFEKLPFIKGIYRSIKQVVKMLGGRQTMGFQRVVIVEFPHPGMKCIGFLTSVMEDADTGRKLANVFVSTTPNPMVGYLQIVPLEQVLETNWTPEEAVKRMMSAGIISPASVVFEKARPVQWEPEGEPVPRSGPGNELKTVRSPQQAGAVDKER